MPKKAVKGEEVTQEERLLQLQQRAQAEEEMAKKKEETLTLYLKDKLQKEQRNASVNLLKLIERWRKNLRQARDAEQLEHVAVLQQTNERKLDEQNFIMQKTKGELQEADRHADQVQRCHLQQEEDLLGQRDRVLMNLEQQWDSSLQNLSFILSSKMEKMWADFRQQNQRLMDLSLPAQIYDKGMCEYIEKLHQEVVDSNRKDQQDLDFLKEEVKNMGCRSVLNRQVLQETRDSLNELDQRMSSMQQINTKLMYFRRLKDKASQLRQQISSLEAEKDLMEQEVTTGKDKLNQKCHKLQDQLAQGRQEVRKEVADFSVQGAAFTKNLQAVIIKGEKVLRAAELCNKLQNQQEVLPLSSEGNPQLRSRAEQKVCESAELQELQEHLNFALLQREALRNHSEDLRQENQQLQVLLDHLDDSLEGHLAPLPVLQVQITSVPPAPDRRHTVIEAAHIVKYCLLDSKS